MAEAALLGCLLGFANLLCTISERGDGSLLLDSRK